MGSRLGQFRLNRPNIRSEILNGARVVADLEARAQRVAAACGPTMVPGVDMIAGVDHGGRRARGYVVTATNRAKYGEAKDRRLTRALEAGRG